MQKSHGSNKSLTIFIPASRSNHHWFESFLALILCVLSVSAIAALDRPEENAAVRFLDVQQVPAHVLAAGPPVWQPSAPMQSDGETVATTRTEADGWITIAEFAWRYRSPESGEWHLIGFELTPAFRPLDQPPGQRSMGPEESGRVQAEPMSSGGPPSPPEDPNAPSGYGNKGDTAVNTINDGYWEWTISYAYGYFLSNGDWDFGWHVTEISATFVGPNDPPIIVD